MARKSNFDGKSLLSQVGGRSTKKRVTDLLLAEDDISDAPSSAGSASPPKKRKTSRPEPATDDDPISSSEEDTQASCLKTVSEPRRRARAQSTYDFEANFALIDAEATAKPLEKAAFTKPNQKQTRRATRSNTITREVDGQKTSNTFSSNNPGLDTFSVHFSRTKKGNGRRYGKSFSKNTQPSPKTDEVKFIIPPEPLDESSLSASDEPQFKVPITIGNLPGSPIPTNSSRDIVETLVFDTGVDSRESSPLSSAPSELDVPADEKRWLPEEFICCPACRERLDPEYLAEHQLENTKGLSIRKQLQFCRQHKRWSAERDWNVRGYPDIDWNGLDERLERYFDDLEQILMRKKPSFFRNSLESSSGGSSKKNTFRLTANSNFDSMSSGYYGPRGSKRMADAIISKFASKIRRIASSDPLIQAAGVSGYIQTVLVPELTVMLVKDDISGDDENARQIIRESMVIGALVNEEQDDIVEIHDEGNTQF
ncbi:hypothetical protein LOY94_005575 [Ophidiomyces ophidiicola]|nr:hypothetical protein LOY94_005575 [Ophidiomyces ophidiicola]